MNRLARRRPVADERSQVPILPKQLQIIFHTSTGRQPFHAFVHQGASHIKF
jgi:hypothetical protein